MSELAKILEWRGDIIENVHQALICVINDQKQVLMQYGNIHDHPIFYRSALKPIQAIPVFESGIIEKFNITSKEAALFCASHRGEEYHIKELQSLMKKLMLSEDQLTCHPSYPLNEEPKSICWWNHESKRKLFHNCSGKHLGMIATARENGWELESYAERSHPLQQRILEILAILSECDRNSIYTGVDGCGVPVHALPLYNMALSYLKLGCPDLIEQESIRHAVENIGVVMTKHPEMVASHQFICTALLEDSNIIAKGGAQGVYTLALKKERISIALKVQSGNEQVWPILIAAILERLNYQQPSTIERLYQLRSQTIVNDGGKVVGKQRWSGEKMLIEVIIQNHKDVLDAEFAGADRVELVSAISEGGLTPSIGTVKHVCKHAKIPVFTMIRPHSSSFTYSNEDKEIILSDIEKVKEYGTDGIVFGALTNERKIDIPFLEGVIKAAQPLPITFHRAIDESRDPIESYKQLCKYPAVKRVLTSGGADYADQGLNVLHELISLQHQLNGPTVMPGSGLTPENFSLIKSLGADEYHFGVGVRAENSYDSSISASKLQLIKNL